MADQPVAPAPAQAGQSPLAGGAQAAKSPAVRLCLECMSYSCVHSSQRMPHLTAREITLLVAASGGASNDAIAGMLRLSTGTVKVYLSRLYRKLQTASRIEMALWAHDHVALLLESSEAATAPSFPPPRQVKFKAKVDLDAKALEWLEARGFKR